MAEGSGVLDEVAVEMPAPRVTERTARSRNGWAMLALVIAGGLGGVALLWWGIATTAAGEGLTGVYRIVGGSLVVVGAAVFGCGVTPVAPGQARVVQLLGRYTGTVRTDGLRWVNPFTRRLRVSTRIRNHETAPAKVNDAEGNPVEIAAVVVWQVDDTAMAVFEVDDFTEFVAIQTETAVRHVANSYPYDAHGDGQLSVVNAGSLYH